MEWNNFASLKSCYRIGYADFGNLYVAGALNRYFLHAGAGCEPYGFRLERIKPTSALRSRNFATKL